MADLITISDNGNGTFHFDFGTFDGTFTVDDAGIIDIVSGFQHRGAGW